MTFQGASCIVNLSFAVSDRQILIRRKRAAFEKYGQTMFKNKAAEEYPLSDLMNWIED